MLGSCQEKVFKANKVASSELTKDALGRIKKLCALEDQARYEANKNKLSPEDFVAHRCDLIEKYLEDFRNWLEERPTSTAPSGPAGKAIQYTLGQWDNLVRFLEHAELTPDNNATANATRPFVLGRSSRPGEFHPQPLTEPYLTVSRHTALRTPCFQVIVPKNSSLFRLV